MLLAMTARKKNGNERNMLFWGSVSLPVCKRARDRKKPRGLNFRQHTKDRPFWTAVHLGYGDTLSKFQSDTGVFKLGYQFVLLNGMTI